MVKKGIYLGVQANKTPFFQKMSFKKCTDSRNV